ncbi:MAG: IS1182 family transposase [Zoogloeaceae bacterium]|nr:IS1182 family transposase [Rhodocyclaceae bacterium]MCP5235107.1 IS1182 family transposase [Zoogloeaceae bacterium]MCP5236375.1 IS1182 family transposase [Zoogloeaceae bacterium]
MSETEWHPPSPAGLFEDLSGEQEQQLMSAKLAREAARLQGPPRVLQANRKQIELRASDLESLLGEDHRARLVWGYVERQDLSRLIESIKARGSNAGRSAIDPHILFALWLYGTLDGVGSGREIARLTRESDAYRWICGGVSVNYHALNDFRSGNEALMDEVLTGNVAALASVGAISLERVAQDGMRVRADAGAASFRRQASLERHLAEAGELVHDIKKRAAADPAAASRRAQAARERAAREREERIRAALTQLPLVQAAKRRNGNKPEEARASTTDADARVMKMGDGGFRPAFNVQLATTCEDQVIVGVDVSKAGSDMAQMAPMVEQVIERTGEVPRQWLVDGGFPAHEQIDAVHAHTKGQTEVIAPVPEPRQKAGKPGDDDTPPPDKHQRKEGDSEPVAQWRTRMADDAIKDVYPQRAATAECVNALARNRGLQRMPVRGLGKVRAVAYLYALAHNLMRMAKIAPQMLGLGTGASEALAAGE